MSIFDLFRRKSGTASPSPDSERGDWIDWFLNREGPAGRFRGSRRPRYGIDYLFNGGGSVRSKRRPRGGAGGGRPSLPEPTPAPTWDTEREYNKFQTRANEPGARLVEQWAFDMNRERDQWPWTLDVTREGQPRGQHKREGQWKVKSSNFKPPTLWASNEGQDSGIMAAVANNPTLVQRAKGFYDLFDPWIPNVDVGENSFGYEFEKPILGGTLGYGLDYDWDDEDVGAFFNWKKELGA
jgi:hypothetical protein